MKNHATIEPLEPRIAPAAISIVGKTATWTDQDGDIVTMKWTSADAPVFTKTDRGLGLVVNSVNLDPMKHDGASFTITVKAAGVFGDGRIEIGALAASSVELGKWNSPKAAIGAVQFGKNGGTAAVSFISGSIGQTNDGASSIRGAVGTLKIIGDLGYGGLSMGGVATGQTNGNITITGNLHGDLPGGTDFDGVISILAGVKSLTIGGSVLNAFVGVQSSDPLQKVTIGGDIISTTDSYANRVFVQAKTFVLKGSILGAKVEVQNSSTAPTSISIGGSLVARPDIGGSGMLSVGNNSGGPASITIKGGLYGTTMATFSGDQTKYNAFNTMGAIHVFGNASKIAIGGSIHAGKVANGNLAINGGIQVEGSLGSLSVGGSLHGYENDPVYLLTGGSIGKLSIKGSAHNAYIAAGTEMDGDFFNPGDPLQFFNINPNANIGSVFIGGNFNTSNIFAGAKDGGSLGVNPTAIGDTHTGTGKLGPVVIKGYLLSERDSAYYAGFAADSIASIIVNGKQVFKAGDGLRNFDTFITAREI